MSNSDETVRGSWISGQFSISPLLVKVRIREGKLILDLHLGETAGLGGRKL